MPIHEYRCLTCGRVDEFMTGMGDKSDPLVCKECGGEGFERLLSSAKFSIGSAKHAEGSSGRCCGSDAPRGECIPGTCCGSKH